MSVRSAARRFYIYDQRLMIERRLELAALDIPRRVMEVIFYPRVKQRGDASVAVGLNEKAIGDIGRKDIAVDAQLHAADFKTVFGIAVAVSLAVIAPVGDISDLKQHEGVQEEIAVVAADEKAFIPAGVGAGEVDGHAVLIGLAKNVPRGSGDRSLIKAIGAGRGLLAGGGQFLLHRGFVIAHLYHLRAQRIDLFLQIGLGGWCRNGLAGGTGTTS